MVASFSDASVLSGDPAFIGRVGAGLMTFCQVVGTEGYTIPFHRERATFVVAIFNSTLNGQGINPFFPIFANSVAADANVLADATQAGTVVLTTTNRSAQAALVTDAHISNAIAAQFNSYIRVPNG